MKDEIAWLKAVSAPAPREPKAERARTHDYFGPSVQNKRYTKDDVEHFKFHHQPVGQAVQEYDVRCDWNTVDVDQLDAEFKAQYAYYPKANCPREEYKGTRWKFEVICLRGQLLAFLSNFAPSSLSERIQQPTVRFPSSKPGYSRSGTLCPRKTD
jgi:hypothetical protein